MTSPLPIKGSVQEIIEHLTGVVSDDEVHAAVINARYSSASEAARKLEESRRLERSSARTSPRESLHSDHGEALPDYDSASTKSAYVPMSSASAAAALLESTANRLSQQPRVVSPMNLQVALPGKRTWNYPQPLCANGPVAGPIPVDPSWTTSGGNTWSNKNRQAKIEGHPLDAIFSGRHTWEKIKWGLSENNIDKRPMIMLEWVETWAHTLAMTGLVKFIESRQRGALFINAAYRTFSPTSVSPDLDWRTLDQLRETRDRHLQKYTSEYNPASCVVVFVYLPSSTGRSVAIWLREIAIPGGLNAEYLVRANDIRIKIDGGRG